MGKSHQLFLEKTKEVQQHLWSDQTHVFLKRRCGSAPDLMCRKGQTAQTHLCLFVRMTAFARTNIVKKVIRRIQQSPGIQTLQGLCQQTVMLAGNPAGWDSVKYLICWRIWMAVELCSSERQRREAAPVHSIADEAMGCSFGEERMEEKACPFIWFCERWTGPGSKGSLSNWFFTGYPKADLSLKCP